MFHNRKSLSRLDSMTKYPSIETYHRIDPATGMLLPEGRYQFSGSVVVTEKIDGVNARIVLLPDGTYILGSRSELLYAQGDRIENPALGIIDTLKNIGERLAAGKRNNVLVVFGEVYGIGNGPWGNYTSRKEIGGFRVFDVATIDEWEDLATREPESIALWREHGGQRFYDEPQMFQFAQLASLDVTPRLAVVKAEALPVGLEETLEWMDKILPESKAKLSPGGSGLPEGLVLRSWTRSAICKLRFKEYRSTLRRLQIGMEAAVKAGLSQ